jgi:hypothetical protein
MFQPANSEITELEQMPVIERQQRIICELILKNEELRSRLRALQSDGARDHSFLRSGIDSNKAR